MKKLFVFVVVVSVLNVTNAEEVYVDANYSGSLVTGSKARPFKSFAGFSLKSGQNIFIKRNSIINSQIYIAGISNIAISSYGEGNKPVINLDYKHDHGIKLVSAHNVVISNIRIINAGTSCVQVIGSKMFSISKLECSHSIYGVQVNDGKYNSTGEVVNSVISHVQGDGIGAWSLREGILIKKNVISHFGNDGIDVLGSYGSIIDGNIVHDSFDSFNADGSPKAEGRGISHVGIKAGGNRGNGGGRNVVRNNVVYNVKNFGIFNRHAVYNIYDSNRCYNNGVNFNFVKSDGPSMATIINNVSEGASFEAGLKYDVFIPRSSDLIRADNNRWVDPLINVKGIGVISDLSVYREKMAPFEANTVFH